MKFPIDESYKADESREFSINDAVDYKIWEFQIASNGKTRYSRGWYLWNVRVF